LGDQEGTVKQAKIVKFKFWERENEEPDSGSEEIIDVDLVLIAAGFLGSEEYVTQAFGVEVNGKNKRKKQKPEIQDNV
jgi:glutamate synthase (NADPH/NADH) small chain